LEDLVVQAMLVLVAAGIQFLTAIISLLVEVSGITEPTPRSFGRLTQRVHLNQERLEHLMLCALDLGVSISNYVKDTNPHPARIHLFWPVQLTKHLNLVHVIQIKYLNALMEVGIPVHVLIFDDLAHQVAGTGAGERDRRQMGKRMAEEIRDKLKGVRRGLLRIQLESEVLAQSRKAAFLYRKIRTFLGELTYRDLATIHPLHRDSLVSDSKALEVLGFVVAAAHLAGRFEKRTKNRLVVTVSGHGDLDAWAKMFDLLAATHSHLGHLHIPTLSDPNGQPLKMGSLSQDTRLLWEDREKLKNVLNEYNYDLNNNSNLLTAFVKHFVELPILLGRTVEIGGEQCIDFRQFQDRYDDASKDDLVKESLVEDLVEAFGNGLVYK